MLASEMQTREIGVAIEAPLWNAACAADHRSCLGELPVIVHNRRDATVFLSEIRLSEAPKGGSVSSQRGIAYCLPRPTAIVPHGTYRFLIPRRRDSEQRFMVRATISAPGERPFQAASAPFGLANPSRAAAREACLAAGGDWGAHGLLQSLGCIARTRDAGKPCRDGGECESVCLFDGYEEIRTPGDSGRTTTLWRPLGHCAELRTVFGCYSYIENGASRENPSAVRVPPPRRCAD